MNVHNQTPYFPSLYSPPNGNPQPFQLPPEMEKSMESWLSNTYGLTPEQAHDAVKYLEANGSFPSYLENPSTPTSPTATTPTSPTGTPSHTTDRNTTHNANVLANDQALWHLDWLQNSSQGVKALNYSDLQRVANDTSLSQDTRDAARYFMDHPEEFNRIDTAGSWVHGESDGMATRNQFKAFGNEERMFEVSDRHDRFYGNWLKDPKNGVTTTPKTADDFNHLAQDPSLPEPTRVAAQYFAKHPEQIDKAFGNPNQGTPPTGTPSTGTPPTGTPPTGTPPTGTPPTGTPPTGTPPTGTPPTGTPPTGTPPTGTPPTGTPPTGTPPTGTPPTGTPPAGNPVPSLGDPSDAMTQKAGNILVNDPAIPDTPLSLDDLKKIANDNSGKYSEQTRQAAQYFVDNPTEFTKVDGSNVNKQSDGFITKAEIRGYFASTPNAPDNLYKAAQGMVNDPNLPTGPLSVDDLKMIANDPKYTQEARDGAKFFSENPTEFKKADLDGNGFLSKDELSKFLGSTGKPQSFPATDENTQNAVKGLQNFAGLPKPFTKADLQRIADDQTADSTVRSNAQYLIDHPDEFDKVDTAGKDGRTGSITEDDMNAYLSQGGHEADVKKNAQILLSDPTTGAMVHNTGVTVDDLKKIVADPNSSSDAKAAAQFFLDNPQDFQRLSGAGSGGKADGLVNDGDIAAYLAERQVVTDGSPDHTRGVMTDLLQDPSVTFPLSTDALQRIAADNTGKYSDKTKFAAQYLLDNRAEFDSVDRASDKSLDGIISKDDALNYMVPPASPDQTKAMTDVLTHNGSLQWPLTQDSLKEIMNNESVNLDTRNAARYFVNHPEEFNNVPVFKPIDGIQPPEDNTNANAAWAADKLRDPNATIYRSNGQTVGTWDGLNTDDLYGIANNSANSLDVRRAALFFAQHRERFDATDQVYNAKDGSISRRDLDKYYYQMTPLWQAPEENSGYDDYYDPVLSKYMHDNNVQSMSKADLEYLRDDITKDHALREAADYWLRFKLTPGYQTVRVQDVDDDRRPDSPTDSGGGGAL